uniref:Golgi autoantigen golgin subfamily a4-like protein n=1 Tax=Philodina roseola TaxID=96448 RepID=B6S325_PHIRO|nr:golgi autoantigen golgin subfamily a4-like protein [Philodina roseola]
MFKNLKEKLATQANKMMIPTAASPESGSGNRTPSIISREDNLVSIDLMRRMRNISYVSPPRQYVPPSDVESEFGGDESDHESSTKMLKMQRILAVYKNKFNQLKNAYDEVEREKENIKILLQQNQDISIRRLTELREQIKLDRQAKEQLECLHTKEMRLKENRIEELTLQVRSIVFDKNDRLTDEKICQLIILNLLKKFSRFKNSKLENLLTRCKDALKINSEKQTELIKERDDLQEKLNEKQTMIESLMKVKC